MKRFTQAKKYLTVAVVSAFAASPAFATEGSGIIDQIFGAIDLSGVLTYIGAAGLVVIGIAMAFKAITLGKRTVNKA